VKVDQGPNYEESAFTPISPAGGITEYGRLAGLPRSDLYAPDPPGQNQVHLDRARRAAPTRQTG
jgi:hypothetical protein